MKNNKYEIDMCNGTIMDKLISFALPLMISGMLQLMFNAVDIIVVGRFTGSQALAAVGSTRANVLAARFYASGKTKEMSETVHTAILLALISGIAMSVIGILCARESLVLIATPDDIIGQAVLYLRIYFLGMPFFMLYNYGAAILRAVGDTKRPLMYLIAAGTANAVLDLVLVIIFKMGVAGVAIGTITSQFISCVLVIRCLCKTDAIYKLYISKLRIKKYYLIQILKVGLPAGIQSTVINFSNVLLQSSVKSFGEIAMAGYTAANNILGFLYVSVNSVTQACMSFTSQNYGVRKFKRMDKVLANCAILSIIVSVVIGGGSYLLGHQILGIYTKQEDVIQCGMEILSISTIPYFLCGLMDMIPGSMRGVGYSAVPMILSIIGTVGTRLVWIYGVFPEHRSLYVLFMSYPVSWGLTIVMQAICLVFVRRKIRK